MSKNPKSLARTDISKIPTTNSEADTSKIPKTAFIADAMKMTPSWRIAKVQMASPWGWHQLSIEDVKSIYTKLVQYEGKTWKTILIDENYWNHRMECYKICKEAKDRLKELELDDLEFLVSLRLGATERIWGYLDHNILNLLWWDPEHEVYPVFKKHT